MRIAFFDLDKTLITVNSASLWIRQELREGYMSKLDALRATGWLIQYQLGFVNLDEAVKAIVESMRGTREAELAARVERFHREQIRGLYRPRAKAVVEQHRASGDRLALLTSGSNYLADLVAEELRLEDVLCTRFEVDASGQYTGRPLGEVCFGAGKLRAAQKRAVELGTDLRDCAFYTDSMADLPLLEVVGKPVAVNPDPRLRWVARRRGWPVHDWGQAA